MFDGMPSDEFHQFIASRTSLPIPLPPFPLHGNPAFSDGFNPYSSSQPLQESLNNKNVGKQLENPLISSNLVLESDGSMDPWSSNEILALLKLRSNMENWFPDLSWEHVSRKLSELGFKRSAEHCKEKFEDESRHFNSISYNKNYRNIFSELDAFYPGDNQGKAHDVSVDEKNQDMEKQNEEDEEEKIQLNVEELGTENSNPSQESEDIVKITNKRNKKRKRRDKFGMFKGFCESIVSKMIAQQEELHNKMIEDMVKRDKEIIKREEAWKNQEMDRIKLESETRAEEEASASERQATIIEFLKKFTSSEDQNFVNKIEDFVKVNNNTSNSATSLCKIFQTHQFPAAQNKPETSTSPSMVASHQNPSSLPYEYNPNATKIPSPPSPSSSLATKNSEVNSSISAITNKNNPSAFAPHLSTNKHFQNLDSRGDIGKRWPRDEVLALINLRCKLSDNIDETKEGAKGPLWERISQGMLELGYKRNAKRCKEKWENINKYFRKTKDSNKKRSIDSRTCPYFHHLNSLYSEGTLVAPTIVPENE